MSAKKSKVAARRNRRGGGNEKLTGKREIVGEIHAAEIDRERFGVVDFDPVIVFERRIRIFNHRVVVRHELVQVHLDRGARLESFEFVDHHCHPLRHQISKCDKVTGDVVDLAVCILRERIAQDRLYRIEEGDEAFRRPRPTDEIVEDLIVLVSEFGNVQQHVVRAATRVDSRIVVLPRKQ